MGGGGILQGSTAMKNPQLEVAVHQNAAGMSGKNGVCIKATVQRINSNYILQLQFQNYTPMNLMITGVMVGNNVFGLSASAQPGQNIMSQQMGSVSVNLIQGQSNPNGLINLSTQVQITTNYENYSFAIPLYPYILLVSSHP